MGQKPWYPDATHSVIAGIAGDSPSHMVIGNLTHPKIASGEVKSWLVTGPEPLDTSMGFRNPTLW